MATRRRSRPSKSWVIPAVSALFLGLALAASSAQAGVKEPGSGAPPAGGDIALTLIPSKAALAPGDETTIMAVVSNSGSAQATVSSLTVSAPARVAAEPLEPAAPFMVEPGGRVIKRFRVVAGRDAAPGDLVAVADLHSPAPAGSGATSVRFLVATTELKLQVPTMELTVLVVSAPPSLSDGQSNGELTVLLRNTTSYDMTDLELRPISSMDIAVKTFGRNQCRSTTVATTDEVIARRGPLSPGEAELVTVCLEVENEVRSGKQKVGVIVSGTLKTPTSSVDLSSSATTEVEVNVFGVSAVGPLGTASLFVLPGVVAFLAFLGFSRLVYPRSSWLPSKVDVSDARWVVGLLPFATMVYFLVWLIWGVNLTEETSTRFVMILFCLGLLTGLLCWVVFIVAYWKALGRKQFKVGDSPERVLKRLAWNKTPLPRPLLTGSATAERVLGYGPGGMVAVCSTIVYMFSETLGATQRQAFSDAVTAGDAQAVVDNLRRGISLAWAHAGVRLLPEADAQVTAQAFAPVAVEQ